MKSRQNTQDQSVPLEEQLVGGQCEEGDLSWRARAVLVGRTAAGFGQGTAGVVLLSCDVAHEWRGDPV